MKEKNNFARALAYLRANGLIKNQKDLAGRIGTTQTTITRNKKGNVRHFDEDTLQKFSAVFGGIINIAYIRGESEKMLVADLTPQEKINIGVNSVTASADSRDGKRNLDMSSLINAALAAKDETIMSLRRELTAKDDIISVLHSQLSDKDNLIADKERYILDLQQQLFALSNHSPQESPQKDFSRGYSYPLGVAEREQGVAEP